MNEPVSWKRTIVLGGGAGVLLALGQGYLILQTFPNNVTLLLILGLCMYLIVPALTAWEYNVPKYEPRQAYRCGVVAGVGSACVVLLLFILLLYLIRIGKAPHLFAPSTVPFGSGPWRGFSRDAAVLVAFYTVVGVQLVGMPLSSLGAWWGSRQRRHLSNNLPPGSWPC